ncbi:Bug family tripartite tricarboxylate transporter substrate binding protein [Falsiroseomonas sp. HW251]|uniref:Bug family tripartite tricarboxylate transporter substrate binding protein n=1 Tax=Falsiroseomonas sp. HW251 TaxID=3390998 RepID=UPI003D323968
MPVPLALPRHRPRPRAALHYLRRRRVVGTGLALAARPAWAQAPWPRMPLRIVVGFAAGGGIDLSARLLARSLADALGQSVHVENRTGANGGPAMEAVLRAGDNHTLLFGNTGSLALNNEFFPDLGYDSLRDFTPVGLLVEGPFFLGVSARLPVATLPDLVAHARAHPGRLTFASNGIGSLHQLAFEQLRRPLGLDIHHVPYRGIALAMPDVAAGRVDLVMDPYATMRPAEEAGQVRLIAVTGASRIAMRPDLPTVAEAAGLPGYEALSWMALMVPASMPEANRRLLESAMAAALQGGELPAALERLGLPPRFRDGAATRAYIEAERARFRRIIREAGIRPEGG